MKKMILSSIICFVPIISIAQIVQIPDVGFERNLIIAGFDTDGVINGQISKADALQVTNMDFIDMQKGSFWSIKNINGIGEFDNLETVSMRLNDVPQFSPLNILFPKLSNLKKLNFDSNSLKTLDITAIESLEELIIKNTVLDVLQMNFFQKLDFGNSPNFNYLNLEECPYLENIVLRNNIASSVYLSFNTILPVCIEVDDPVAATNNQAPYDTWTITGNHYFSDICTLSIEKFVNDNFKIYPNPAIEYLSIEQKATDGVTLQAVQILDSSGKWIKSIKDNFNQIDVSNLNKGMYIFVIQTDKGNKAEKIVIK